MRTGTIQQAKRNLSRLLKEVSEGNEITITIGAKSVARLIPFVDTTKKRKPGLMKGKFSLGPEFFDPLPEDEMAGWEGRDPEPSDDKK